MEPKKDDPGAIPEPSDRRIGFEALFIKLSVKQGSVQLLTKTFFNNSQVVEFVSTIQPFLYVLLAASFLFTGYLIIFQKKFDREGFLINLFITLLILGLLSPTMKVRSKLEQHRPVSIGQASRISGITPAAISISC